jgi:hypothetical protein
MDISFNWIQEKFVKEFTCCETKFQLFQFPYLTLDNKDNYHQPGVYIFLDTDNKEPIKVGKHNVDSFWRAKQHIRDNTGKCMRELAEQSKLELILINLKKEYKNSDLHWIYAIEIYFELLLRQYGLKIKADRI